MNAKLSLSDKKMLIATTIGSVFEVFDFLIFVFLSPIIAKLFFPAKIHGMAIIFTYLTITISYLLRPVGGLILGDLGDRYGRKSVFTASILLMSIPSFAIGLMPTFAHIGYLATILMVIARILHGFSLGGEVPGSITYISEKFEKKNYFFYCAWLTFGANLGVTLGSQTFNLIEYLSKSGIISEYAWRIPFLFGGLLTIVGFYIRYSVTESEPFQRLQQTKQTSKAPLIQLIKEFKPQLICGILLSIIVSVVTSVFNVFLPNLFINYSHLSVKFASDIGAVGALSLGIFSLIIAYFSFKIKPIILIRIALIGLCIIFGLMVLKIIDLEALILHNLYAIYILVIVISLCLSGINGVFFGILANLFPTQVRFSGISSCYNIAFILGAGLTPLWTSMILRLTGSYTLIIAICLIIAFISLINTILLKKITKNN